MSESPKRLASGALNKARWVGEFIVLISSLPAAIAWCWDKIKSGKGAVHVSTEVGLTCAVLALAIAYVWITRRSQKKRYEEELRQAKAPPSGNVVPANTVISWIGPHMALTVHKAAPRPVGVSFCCTILNANEFPVTVERVTWKVSDMSPKYVHGSEVQFAPPGECDGMPMTIQPRSSATVTAYDKTINGLSAEWLEQTSAKLGYASFFPVRIEWVVWAKCLASPGTNEDERMVKLDKRNP